MRMRRSEGNSPRTVEKDCLEAIILRNCKWRMRGIRGIVFISWCVIAAACTPGSREGSPPVRTIAVGVVPDEEFKELVRTHQPLVDYLEAATGQKAKLVHHETYESLVDAFVRGDVQLAWFGGLTFVMAKERAGAIPIAMRDIDLSFESVFLVRASFPARSMSDLRGSRLCFASEQSTAGHLMPRVFLEDWGIDPESFFSEVKYVEQEGEAVRRLRDGEADVATVSAPAVKKMNREGRLDPREVRILRVTPRFRNRVWAAHPDLNEDLQARLLAAFLALDPGEEAHRAILKEYSAGGFVPARDDDYDALEAIARSHGMLSTEPSS